MKVTIGNFWTFNVAFQLKKLDTSNIFVLDLRGSAYNSHEENYNTKNSFHNIALKRKKITEKNTGNQKIKIIKHNQEQRKQGNRDNKESIKIKT